MLDILVNAFLQNRCKNLVIFLHHFICLYNLQLNIIKNIMICILWIFLALNIKNKGIRYSLTFLYIFNIDSIKFFNNHC